MPEIVEHGDPARFPGRWPYALDWKCPQCGCRFRLAERDAVQITYDQRDGTFASFPCPECCYPVIRGRP